MSSGELRGMRINEEGVTPNSPTRSHRKNTLIVTTLSTNFLAKIDLE